MSLASIKNKKIVIIIPARHDPYAPESHRFNRLNNLISCLQSIIASISLNESRSKYRWKKIQVFLVDDKSPTPIEILLPEELKVKIQILNNQGTSGQAGALNYAISNIAADVYAFTDSDCIVAQNWISVLAEHYSCFPTHIGVVGPNWLFIKPSNWWKRWLTRQESLLTQYIFKSCIDFKEMSTWRIDCRNFSIRADFLFKYHNHSPFFIEEKGPSVSGQTSYCFKKNIHSIHNLVIGFNNELYTYHLPVNGLLQQILTYYHRGRYGDFNKIYSRYCKGLVHSFFRRYLARHFISPSIHGNVFWPFLFLAHSAYWIGIVLSSFFDS